MSLPEPELEFAQESDKTKKAREKLMKKFEVTDLKITPEALKKKTTEIHRWISRHAHHRVPLKNKDICLFDENQNTAQLSRRVATLADKLKEDFFDPAEVELNSKS